MESGTLLFQMTLSGFKMLIEKYIAQGWYQCFYGLPSCGEKRKAYHGDEVKAVLE